MKSVTRAIDQFIAKDYIPTILRVVLGLIFIIGGFKLAFHADPAALAASYTNPASGWISPVFVELINNTLRMEVSLFLQIQGWIEMLLGLALVFGIFTSVVAIIVGLLYWSFTIANPVAGQIRLSRDIALMGLCFALALAGSGALSLDRLIGHAPNRLGERKNAILLLIRLSLAYTFLASAIFTGGAMSNHLNSTLPLPIVFLLGLLLAVGIFPKWIMGIAFLWMLYLMPVNLFEKGFYMGLDSVKRELGFLAGSLVYMLVAFVSGQDRWAWPRPRAG